MLALVLLLALPQAPAPAAPPPTFEVASLKLDKSATDESEAEIANGAVHVHNIPLLTLVQQAWELRPEQISGAPAWMDSDRYDLAAKAADHSAGVAELRLMLRNLLIERFHMAVHLDTAEHAAWVLTLAPGADDSKLGPATPETPEVLANEGCRRVIRSDGLRELNCTDSMELLALSLPLLARGYFNHTTVDQTGLSGVYTVDLVFAPNDGVTVGPSLFDALKQLGIRVEDKKVMLPQLVIDHIDRRPSEN